MKLLRSQRFTFALALTFLTVAAKADTVGYAYGLFQQFGSVNLSTGTFTPIGPGLADGGTGLVSLNGRLLTLTYGGNLSSINPNTGVATLIGATGLDDCSLPTSPCGPTSANTLAAVGGVVYATDTSGNVYTVNTTTGAATLLAYSALPALTTVPFSNNPLDGSTYLYDETLFGHNGSLYATFDSFYLATDGYTKAFVNEAYLYQIDPLTGLSTLIGPTTRQILSAADFGGTIRGTIGGVSAAEPFPGFQNAMTLDLSNGNTTLGVGIDPAAGPLFSVAPLAATPEPGSLALMGTGMASVAAMWKRRRRS